MGDLSFLDWPFFEPRHKALAAELDIWGTKMLGGVDHDDVDAACRRLVGELGDAGWLAHTGGALDVRTLCLIRSGLAYRDGLADFAFAMQGLGTGAISLFGSKAQKGEWLPLTRAGRAISAFALTEPGSGSDVASGTMTAVADGNGFVLNGDKTWISNGGIADIYTVFARTGEAEGARGLSAFLVPADAVGLSVAERQETIAPHPLATLHFRDCRVPESALIGARGQGFRRAWSGF